MKIHVLAAAVMAGAFSVLTACQNQPVAPVLVPGPGDQTAYRPQPMPKPLPPDGYIPGMPPPGQMPGGQPGAGPVGVAPSIRNEDAFVAAYAKRSPRMMIFVNRTIQGEPLPADGLKELVRVEETQTATGGVNVASNRTVTGSSQSTNAGIYGSGATNSNTNRTSGSSFASGGPAEYTKTTSVKTAADAVDWVGATSTDYQMIESSMVEYFDNSGKVQVKDSDAARARLSREQVLRIENGDPAANRLLAVELQQDVLIRVTAVPTRQAANGQPAVRLIAKAVGTSDARNLGNATVDMPLPMSKTNINIYTRYLSEELMGKMAQKWTLPAEYDPIEVRIYKAASVDDTLKIRQWLLATKGVKSAKTNGATGSSTTAYASFDVGYDGAPEDLYADLRAAIGMSQGLKAVDLQSTTINLEVSGPMNLVTTTRHTESTTTTETRTTEDRRIEPINPAPLQQR